MLTNLGNVTIEVPSRKTFEAEGAILKQALSDCLRDQRAALAQLADAARQVDKAAFGSTSRQLSVGKGSQSQRMRIPFEWGFGADDRVRRLHDARAVEAADEQQWLAISCDLFN